MKKLFTLFSAALAAVSANAVEAENIITISDITSHGAYIQVTPADDELLYTWDVISVEEYEAIEAGEYAEEGITSFAGYMTAYMNYLMDFYASFGMEATLVDFLFPGEDDYTYDNLDAGTEYIVYMMTADFETGELLPPFATKRFTTAEGADEIQISDITAVSAQINVIPAKSNYTYYWDALSAEDYDAIASGAYASMGYNSIGEYYSSYLPYMAQMYADRGYTLEDFLSQGAVSYKYRGLDPDTEYVVFAMVADPETGACQEPFVTTRFTTLHLDMSDLKIKLSYADNKLNIEASNNDPYFFWIESQEDYEYYTDGDYSDAALKAEIEDWIYTIDEEGYTFYAIKAGSESLEPQEDFWSEWFEGAMEEGVEYVAMAAPYTDTINGAVTYLVFTYSSETGIQILESKTVSSNSIYGINGMRLNKAVKGMNIINGKKVMNK